jgi:hypothetical protein
MVVSLVWDVAAVAVESDAIAATSVVLTTVPSFGIALLLLFLVVTRKLEAVRIAVGNAAVTVW